MENSDISAVEIQELDFLKGRIQRLEKVLEIQQRFALLSGFLDNKITVKNFLDQLSDGLLLIDSTGTIILVNTAAEELFGHSLNEITGSHLNVLIPERFQVNHDKMLEGFFDKPRHRPMGYGIELKAVSKDGREFPADISLSYLKTGEGMFALAFIHDISERKKKEEQLIRKNKELDAYARTIAHDINSSLAAIVGISDNLIDSMDQMDKDEMMQSLGFISESARKLSVVVKEILLFTHLEKEKISLEKLDMQLVLKEALKRLKPHLTRKNANLSYSNKLHNCMGHNVWVEEVWYNLIDNAIKYGGKTPEIEIGSEQDGKGGIKYRVSDNGQGMDKATIDRILNEGLSPSQAKGHGIGLSIVRMILEKLGGSLSVTSTKGKGTGFFFTLPAWISQKDHVR
ncbi:MAG: PAS domain S-box protein [Bacteroidales bacterium]|nr:PAS domain S-box protein [Bacteroidales bacterium]